MIDDDQQQNFESSNSAGAVRCLALTAKVVSDLQVCVSSVELLEGMALPAEAHLPVARLARAVDALIAAAAVASRSDDTIEDRLAVGSPAERN